MLVERPRIADACSVCLSSDSTYTLLGQEADHPQRIRVSNENLWVQKSQGDEFHSEWRSYLGLTYGVTDRVTIAATVPWIWKGLRDEGLNTYTRGIGDAEALARVSVWQNRPLGATHVVRVSAGAQVPTGNNWVRDDTASSTGLPAFSILRPGAARHAIEANEPADGRPALVDEHSQIGSGAFAGIAGVDYQYFGDKFGVGGGVLGRIHTRSSRGFRYGNTILASVSYLYQGQPWLMLGVGPLYRYASRDKLAGKADPDSGGGILYVEPAVTVRAKTWFSVRAKVAQPVATHLNGEQREYPVYSLALSTDVPL